MTTTPETRVGDAQTSNEPVDFVKSLTGAASMAESEARDEPDDGKCWTLNYLAAKLRDAASVIAAPAAPAPEPGWKLTPEIPDEGMMRAGLYQSSHDATYADVCQAWIDMWRAAPEPTAAPPAPVAASAVNGLRDAADYALNALIGSAVSAGGVDDRATILEAQRRLRTALAAPPSSPNPVADNPAGDPVVNAPRVRELVWKAVNDPSDGRGHYGTGVFGHWYLVSRVKAGMWACVHHVVGEVVHLPPQQTLEAAKAAAQSDYEGRVLACLEPGQGWRDIASAPRDGTRILCWSIQYGSRETFWHFYGEGSPAKAKFDAGLGPSGSWDWHEPQSHWAASWNPTHWLPLPPPPAAEGSR